MSDTQPKLTPATFLIWLQGFLEGAGSELTASQLSALKEKLHAVFTHFDPDADSRTSDSVSDELRRLYDEYLRNELRKVPFSPYPVTPPYTLYRDIGPGHPGSEPWSPYKYVYTGPIVTQTLLTGAQLRRNFTSHEYT